MGFRISCFGSGRWGFWASEFRFSASGVGGCSPILPAFKELHKETISLLQQPGPQKFKLSKIELIYKAKKFKVPPFTIYAIVFGRHPVEGRSCRGV